MVHMTGVIVEYFDRVVPGDRGPYQRRQTLAIIQKIAFYVSFVVSGYHYLMETHFLRWKGAVPNSQTNVIVVINALYIGYT